MTVTSNRSGISLRELSRWGEMAGSHFVGAEDIRVSSCTSDSRSCLPGDLFAALVGVHDDGHHHIRDAIARGAKAILCEQPVPAHGVPQCIVEDSRAAYGRICQTLVGNPSSRLRVIGVTGTNGKTTTTCLIASVLEAAGCNVGILGTLGYCDGREVGPAALTTPAPHDSAAWLARMEANGCSHAVMEVSSHALSQRRVAGIEFDLACVTNVRRDHLDYHGTLANYRAAKQRLFEQLREGAVVVLNADDPACAAYLADLTHPVLSVGMRSAGELTATVVERQRGEQTFLLTAGKQTVPVRTRMIGDHHVQNCLIAAAAGVAYGIDLACVVRGLESLERVPGRMDRIECGQPFGVFVDYAHTPDALSNVLRTLREVTTGRVRCVFGCGGNRDRDKRPLMGEAVERGADAIIVTADNPRGEDPEDIARHMLKGMRRPERVHVELDRAAAICLALAEAQPGDCVLIAGKGHEDYQIIGGQRIPMDDRQIVRDWLYANLPNIAIQGAAA